MTVLDFSPPPLATLAADQFRRRQARARAVVEARRMTLREAESALRPWLAIACLCGADLPELIDLIAEERVTHVDGAQGVTDGEARSLVARSVCPRANWIAALATARDAALAHHERLHGLATSRHPPEQAEVRAALAQATALTRIAAALRVRPYQPKPMEIAA